MAGFLMATILTTHQMTLGLASKGVEVDNKSKRSVCCGSIIDTYVLGARETVCFMIPRPAMFPEAQPRDKWQDKNCFYCTHFLKKLKKRTKWRKTTFGFISTKVAFSRLTCITSGFITARH